jgi:hypothetical protein
MSFGAKHRPRRRFHVAAIIPIRTGPRCPNPHSYVPRREMRKLVADIFGNFYYAKNEYIHNFQGGAARLARKTKLPLMGEMISPGASSSIPQNNPRSPRSKCS